MQNISYDLTNILSGSVRDFVPVDLIEFYEPGETSLVPGNAVKRFANTRLVWYGWEYEQQAISRGSTMRYIDERFNTCSLTFSNVDREVGRWLSSTSIAGYRVLIRAISRSVDDQSIVLFVGRCEKPFSVNNSTVSLTIKQDLGSINSELPARKFTHACPLKFKGTECLGGQTAGQKSTAYNNAATCDKSWQQCVSYANTDFFQGFRSTNVTGSFVLREASSFGIPTKSTKQWSSQDQTPINQHVPMGLGRTQIELTPIASADTGQFLYGHWVAGEGPITKFLNTRNVTPGFARRFEGQNSDGTPTGTGSYREHLGEYGNDPDQRSVSDFLGYVSHSRRAYIEGTIRGQNPDTGDPAPTIVSTILWNPIPTPGQNQKYDGQEWTDNPVHQVRYLLTNEQTLQYPVDLIDDQAAIETARYCDEPLYDRSGGEDLVVVQNSDTTNDSFVNGRFRSTGLIDPFFWRRRRIATEPESAAQYANINYFSTQNLTGYDEFGQPIYQNVPPPTNLVPNEYFRKRYTGNWHLKKGVKVSDFLFKQLLPSFRGYLVTGADGRLQIRSERSAVQSRSSGAVTTQMNTIDVYDGIQFKDLSLPVKYLLIRNPESTITRTSIRRIVSVDYLAASNGITIAAPSSGAATMNCKIYGADLDSTSTTFTGGSIDTQAYAYIIVTDGLSQNSTAGVRIDGVDVGGGGPVGNTSAYASQNWSPEIAAMIATNLNGNPNLKNVNGVALRDYIEAVWEPSNPLMVLFRSKQATLILDAPFSIDHPAGELVTHFHLPFSDGTDGTAPNILKDSFEWPLGNRQSGYNQFTITYQDAVQDSQSVAIVENDYDHQEATNQINKLEVPGGDCVDNYHQADRLLLAARYKYRESDFFVQFQTAGLGMLLEEGDLILVNHSSMPLYRNYLYRIEELSVSQDHRVSITARLYSDLQYPDQPVAKTVPLIRSNAWPTTTLPPVTNLTITRVPNSGNTARISFRFPASIVEPLVRVYVQRRDPDTGEFIDATLVDTGIILRPDASNDGIVEIPGLVTGSIIQLVPFTETGIQGDSVAVGVPQLPTDAGGGGGTGTISEGDYGDITVTNSGLTWTIDNTAVTLAKMANMATDSLIGRDTTGTGSPEVITLSQALDFVGSPAQGDILYRGASTWTRLGAGTSGRVLQTKGTGANPEWAPAREVLTAARTYFVGFSLGSVTANATTDKIEKTAHGLENGDPVAFNAATAPSGITLGTIYYVRNKTADNFEIFTAATGGTQVTWTTNGSTVTCHTGNDNNSGIGTNGRSVALLTIQKAIDLAAALDSSTFDVTIQVCDGQHNLSATLIPKNMVGAGKIIVSGNVSSYTGCVILMVSGAVTALWNQESVRTVYRVQGFNFQTNQASLICLRAIGATTLEVANCRFAFGTQSFSLMFASASSAFILIDDACDFTSCGTQSMCAAADLGVIRFFKVGGSVACTFTGSPANSAGSTFSASRLGFMRFDSTSFTGALAGNASITRIASLNGCMFQTITYANGVVDTPSTGGVFG